MSAIKLKDRIRNSMPKLADILDTDYRDALDILPTILDLSFSALKTNMYKNSVLSPEDLSSYKKLHANLVKVVRAAASRKTFSDITDEGFQKAFTTKNKGAILIYTSNENIFLVGKNFDAIRSFTSTYISSNALLADTIFGKREVEIKGVITEKSNLDIGHTSTEGLAELTSPLEEKITAIVKFINDGGPGIPKALKKKAEKALKDLYKVQAKFKYSFKNTSTELIDKAKSALPTRDSAGIGYIVVTLHTSEKNNEFSVIESRIYNKLVAEMSLVLTEAPNFSGSNTIIQDVIEGITNILSGSKKKLTPHKEQTGTESISVKDGKISISDKSGTYTPPKLRGPKGKFTSLAAIQIILNERLAEQVKKNMGKGSAKATLNNRTGLFSQSVKVERMSADRMGVITAFYTYMKYPYQTFEPGYVQGLPESRDPKKLITKSIREIAVSLATTRLRMVLV